jgi:peptide/nickel transport system permease protein
MISAVGLAIAVAVPAGVVAALVRDSWIDRSLQVVGVFGQAVPSFWLAIVLIFLFSVQLHVLPVAGMGGPLNFILPSITLGAVMMAGLFRLTRASMLEVLDTDYVKFARIKGLSEWRVILVHALRNALLAPLTFATIYVGLLIGGSVVIETVFNWPGLGRLAYEAVLSRDLPVIQGVVTIAAASVIFANLAADLLYKLIDPRITY